MAVLALWVRRWQPSHNVELPPIVPLGSLNAAFLALRDLSWVPGLLAWQMRKRLAPRLQQSSDYERGSVFRASSPSSESFLTTSKLCFSSMTFSIAGIT